MGSCNVPLVSEDTLVYGSWAASMGSQDRTTLLWMTLFLVLCISLAASYFVKVMDRRHGLAARYAKDSFSLSENFFICKDHGLAVRCAKNSFLIFCLRLSLFLQVMGSRHGLPARSCHDRV